MQNRDVWWVSRPTTDDDEPEGPHDYEHLRVAIQREDYAINSRDQLIVPVRPQHRLTSEAGRVDLSHKEWGYLVQYGGAELALELMTGSATDPTEGTEWYVYYDPRHGFGVTHVSEWEPPFEWVQTEMTG